MDKINLPSLSSPYYGITTGFSRSFQNLIRDIGDTRSKCEEDRIMQREVQYLKTNIDKPNVDSKQMKEYLIRLIYCEMLGHDASFGFIHAINFTQKGKLMEKRIGYLACCLLLHENHELTLLLMNALQKDLKSTNIMENCIALIAASRLVNRDTIPTVLPLVINLLQHKREMVRKKAIMVLLRFHSLDQSSIINITSKFESTLCDRNPGVMATTLNVYLRFVTEAAGEFKRLTGAFVNILKQVIEFRLPNEFTYYNVPAPWIQIKLFRILAQLGRDDQQQSEKMYEILKQCIETAYIENNIGCAVLSECLYTAATIHPNKQLSENAARRVGLLLMSKNNNLKYLGIKILAHLINSDVSYAFRHQMTVIDCLNDPDETLKRKTLVLLYRITNSSNVSVICNKLINYLRSSVDEHLRSDLVDKITTLAEKYAPDNEWFIETMNEVFELGGSLVSAQVAHNIMRLIGEGTDDDESDTELRLYAVNSYLDLTEKNSLPDILIHLICWVIGEYSYLASHCEPEVVMDKLCSLFERKYDDKSTRSWIVTAITKIAGRLGYLPDNTRQVIEKFIQQSADVELNQRCADLLAIFNIFDSFNEILPIDASCEDLEVDPTLSFLDGFVSEALAKGASPYLPKHLRHINEPKKTSSSETKKIQLNLSPYPAPQKEQKRQPTAHHSKTSIASMSLDNQMTNIVDTDYPKQESISRKSVKQVWGPSGYMGDKTEEKQREDQSDTSSTTSGSGSISSGIVGDVNYKQKEISLPSAVDRMSEDTERMTLAQQIFTTTSLQGSGLRPEKAGFHTRKRLHKHNKMQNSLEVESSDNIKPSFEKETSKNAFDHHENKENLKQDGSLLLDLDDSGINESSSASNTIMEDHRTNISLLDDLVLESHEDQNATELKDDFVVEQQYQDASIFLQDISNQERLLPSVSAEEFPNREVNILDQDDGEFQPPSLDSSTQFIQERSIPKIPSNLEIYPASPLLSIGEDVNIKIDCHKVLTPDSLILVMYTTNQKSVIITDVNWSFRPPLNLDSSLDDSKELNSYIERLNGWQIQTHVMSMKLKSPSRHMILDGQTSYRDSTGNEKRLFKQYPLTIIDFIRSLRIDTETYAGKWAKTGYEKKIQIGAKNERSFQSLLQVIELEMNFAIVQIIGNEAIAAGTILSKDECLLHFKHSSTTNEFRLKTGSELLNECIMTEIKKSF